LFSERKSRSDFANEKGGTGIVIRVESSQKFFTDTETANLTGICLEHLHGLARSMHLGFIARPAQVVGMQPDQWLFTLSDLMVLVTLHPRCEHWPPPISGGSRANQK